MPNKSFEFIGSYIKRMSSLCFLLLFAVVTCAQHNADSSFDFNRKLDTSRLKADLRMFKDSLQIIHPALYRYTSKEKFDGAFADAEKLLDKPMTTTQFYGILAPIAGMVGDIHTTIEPSDESLNYLATGTLLFPFDVRIIGSDIYCASNNSVDSTIPVGSRILKINDEPIAIVLKKMKTYFSDEGHNETLKVRQVEQRFAFQYYLAFGYSGSFKLEYETSEANTMTKTVAAQPFSVIRQRRTVNTLKFPGLKSLFNSPPYLSLKLDNNRRYALMRIATFENGTLRMAGENFKSFVDSSFKVVRQNNIVNLVIDIRNNDGGESENAAFLYSYLANKPFRFLFGMEAGRKIFADDLKRGVKFRTGKDGKYLTTDSTTNLPQFFGLNVQPASLASFSGNVYLLTDGLTTSAAPQFASLIIQNKRGVVIGENAPGSLYGGSGRGYSYFRLPHSELLVMISHYRLYLTDPGSNVRDSCIIPDYLPVRSISDLLNGIDRDLEFAIRLIK